MHGSADFLQSLAAVFCVAALTTLICLRLRLPSVLGLIAAGMLVGPFGPRMSIASGDTVAALSELGVIFLMFTIGLELQLKKLAEIGLRGLCIALSGVGFMLLISFGLAQALGISASAALFLAAALSISSTMTVSSVLTQSAQKALRQNLLGVLVIEDILAMLLLAALTLFGKSSQLDGAALLLTLGRLLGFLLALVLIGALVVPKVVRFAARQDRDDVLLVVVMGVCFFAVLAAQTFGYPVALGAFVAGTLSAESGASKRIEGLSLPLKDVFTSVFFVSAGMAIDPGLLPKLWPWILLFASVVILGKSLGVALGFFFTGLSVRQSVQAGMNMGQTGEFGLVIAALGVSLGVGQEFLFPVIACVAAITMVLTPGLAHAATPCANFIDAKLPRRVQNFAALYGSWIERMRARTQQTGRHVRLVRRIVLDALLLLVVGLLAALFADDVQRLLRAHTELARSTARWAVYGLFILLIVPIGLGLWRGISALGNELAMRALPTTKGHESDPAQAPRKAFVMTLQLAIWLVVSLPILVLLQPFWPNMPLAIIVLALFGFAGFGFWRSTGELQSHTHAGSFAVLEAFKSFTAEQQIDSESEPVKALEDLLPGMGEFVAISLEPNHPWIGRTLAHVNLRAVSGANVIAIVRGDQDVVSPDGKQTLCAGDSLVLSGSREALCFVRELHSRQAH